MKQKFTKNLMTLGKVVLAIGLIYYLVHKGSLDFSVFQQVAQPVSLGLLFLIMFVGLFLNNIRWGILLAGQGIFMKQFELFKLTFIGLFFNYAMPGGVGGDVIKGVYLVKDQAHHKYSAAVSIFMDRAVGFLVMTIVASASLIYNWGIVSASAKLMTLAFAIFALTLSFFVFFAFSLSLTIRESRFIEKFFELLPLGEKFRKIYLSLHSYRKAPRALVLAILISFVSQLIGTYFFYFVGQILHIGLPLDVYLFIIPAGMIILALPISPAGVGVGQVAFLYLFGLVLNGDNKFGATAITLSQVIQLCWSLIGAIFYIQRRGTNADQRTSVRDEAAQIQ
jgi:uncharacterized protein (TIRG00374 family)